MELRRRGGAPVTFSAHVFPTSVGFESHKQRFGGAFSFILFDRRARVHSRPRAGRNEAMRQLFLPACVCLVTWSGATATNTNPRFGLEEFTGSMLSHAAAETDGRAPSDQSSQAPSIDIKIPDAAFAEIETSLAETPAPVATAPAANAPVADVLANLDIEYPVPSGAVVNNGIPIGIPLPPVAKPVIARSTEEICDTLTKSAQINNLPVPFFIRLLFQESRFNPGVISSAGAQGIAQFMPATAEDMGVSNPFDPRQAIPASARLLNDLLQKFGNLGLAAAAYNAGPKRIQDWLGSKGKGKLPEETQGYVKTITGKPVENWSAAQARHPGQKLPRRAPCQEAAGLLAWNGPDQVPMPQPSPLRATPPVEKNIVVASIRSDLKHADRAEHLAAAAKSVAAKPAAAKPAAIKTAATQATAAKAAKNDSKTVTKTDAKDADKAAVKPAAKKRIKTAHVGQEAPQKVAQQ
jgi:soluble lytic murein transglycosylase-like protein